jgi:hypothetical protein
MLLEKYKIMLRSLSILLLLSVVSQGLYAQADEDTSAVIREFDNLMAFATQPHLHYTFVLALHSGPMLPPADTGQILHGNFYKSGDDLYYGTEQQETYLQDSLMIVVDHRREMIRINKVDVATKKNMDLLPLAKKKRQKLFRNEYTISKMPDQGDTAAIVMRSHPIHAGAQVTTAEIFTQYSKSGQVPLMMRLTTEVRQQQSPQVMQMLRTSGYDVQRMSVDEGGVRSLLVRNTMALRYGTIDTTVATAQGMPWWKDRIAYDPRSGNFSGKGQYGGYRIIKTF